MHFYVTVALSAFLLFLVQPLIAKQILPWFGGTSAVWTTCMLFFQAALLAGYAYADASPRWFGPRKQPRLHIVVAVICALVLPIVAPEWLKPQGSEEPITRILMLLAVTIGLPYFLLSTTSPLIQSYFARLNPGKNPYRLFALSNAASLIALVSYPVLIEPFVGVKMQAYGWSMAFVVFVVLVATLAWRVSGKDVRATAASDGIAESATNVAMPARLTQLRWIALSAAGSMLLLSVSNHITQNVASVPLLWILPLTLYLLTFILTFDGTGWYRRNVYVGPFFILVAGMCFLLVDKTYQFDLVVQTSVFCVGLFVVCMVCHGELVEAKPAPSHLTRFYLLISVGGALGALVVSVVAPLVFPTFIETSVSLLLATLLFVPIATSAHVFLKSLAVFLVIGVVGTGAYYVKLEHDNSIEVSRNFYGVMKIKAYDEPTSSDYLVRMVHGAILHGEQYLHEKWRREPTTYYTPTSGFGRAVNYQRGLAPRSTSVNGIRIGMIGLGAGTVAAYCREQDTCRIYEINAEVERLARKHFTYLADSKSKLDVVIGDARLSLEREASNQFNVLAVDAFSGDSIPMHLITDEAVRVFMAQLASNGILAYHVSNRFLNLPPVLAEIAAKENLAGIVIEDPSKSDNALHSSSTWVLLAKKAETLSSFTEPVAKLERTSGAPLWTDDFNNLISVIKWKH